VSNVANQKSLDVSHHKDGTTTPTKKEKEIN